MAPTATWTTPRDWADGETVTASIQNTHVRDNLYYLYTNGQSGALSPLLLMGA